MGKTLPGRAGESAAAAPAEHRVAGGDGGVSGIDSAPGAHRGSSSCGAQPHPLRELLAELEATQRRVDRHTGFNEMTLLRPPAWCRAMEPEAGARQQAQRLQNQLKHRFRGGRSSAVLADDPQSAYRSSPTARATQAMAP
ncbi:hypothetical protein M8494_20360 [Serratia ureilytica]